MIGGLVFVSKVCSKFCKSIICIVQPPEIISYQHQLNSDHMKKERATEDKMDVYRRDMETMVSVPMK